MIAESFIYESSAFLESFEIPLRLHFRSIIIKLPMQLVEHQILSAIDRKAAA